MQFVASMGGVRSVHLLPFHNLLRLAIDPDTLLRLGLLDRSKMKGGRGLTPLVET
jgi:hypothetical protein